MKTILKDDEYSVFDEFSGQWLLTPAAVLKFAAIDLYEELKDETNTETQVEVFLREISDEIYSYIHDFATNNEYQDMILGNYDEGRKLVMRAMLAQVKYVKSVGFLNWTTDEKKLTMTINETAKSILNRPLRCYGFRPITYCGV